MEQPTEQYRPRRYEVVGADGVRLMAWDYAAAAVVAPRGTREPGRGRGPGRGSGPGNDSGSGHGGDGRPAVLLLHGLLGRASHWAETARRLAPRYRAIALDQRGRGPSAHPQEPSAPEVYAADATAAVEQLGLGPVVVVGHGTGALTACHLRDAGGRAR
jgi:pimeloyl-ACP methyl ester carboxylesterase